MIKFEGLNGVFLKVDTDVWINIYDIIKIQPHIDTISTTVNTPRRITRVTVRQYPTSVNNCSQPCEYFIDATPELIINTITQQQQRNYRALMLMEQVVDSQINILMNNNIKRKIWK